MTTKDISLKPKQTINLDLWRQTTTQERESQHCFSRLQSHQLNHLGWQSKVASDNLQCCYLKAAQAVLTPVSHPSSSIRPPPRVSHGFASLYQGHHHPALLLPVLSAFSASCKIWNMAFVQHLPHSNRELEEGHIPLSPAIIWGHEP